MELERSEAAERITMDDAEGGGDSEESSYSIVNVSQRVKVPLDLDS
jgi:hypothetical protein